MGDGTRPRRSIVTGLGDPLLLDVLCQAADDRDVLGMAPRAAVDDVAAHPRVVKDVALVRLLVSFLSAGSNTSVM